MKAVFLKSDNIILKVLGIFRRKHKAVGFVRENYSEFELDFCQYSKYNSDQFITIEDIKIIDC